MCVCICGVGVLYICMHLLDCVCCVMCVLCVVYIYMVYVVRVYVVVCAVFVCLCVYLYSCTVTERWFSQIKNIGGVGTTLLHKMNQQLYRKRHATYSNIWRKCGVFV